MDQLVRDGKVRYIGASNYSALQTTQGHWISERRGLARWVNAQNSFNLLDGPDDPQLPEASRALGFGLIPYMPLAAGVLSGKSGRGKIHP